MRYPVTITADDGQFTVTFPDVPAAVTFGETREEALERARDALLTVLDAFMKDRRDIPRPSRVTRHWVELPALETAKIELYRAMRTEKVGKAQLAKRLQWHLPQVDRVLHVKHGSRLDQMEAAFAALGKRIVLSVVDEARADHPDAVAVARAGQYRRSCGAGGRRSVGPRTARKARKR